MTLKTLIALAIFIPVMLGVHRLGWWGTETYGYFFALPFIVASLVIGFWIDHRDGKCAKKTDIWAAVAVVITFTAIMSMATLGYNSAWIILTPCIIGMAIFFWIDRRELRKRRLQTGLDSTESAGNR